jgi:hypoxanthine phosphoribosyltransferase
MGLSKDIESVLYSEEQLLQRVKELGEQITRDYGDKKEEILLVSVLQGSYIFMADLSRAIDLPVRVDFMSVSSYGSGTRSSGQVEIKKDISLNLEGYHIIIVEDILDSGNTLSYLIELLKVRRPSSIKICTLFDKPARRTRPIKADYVGFTVPDAFVVGYGLDYDQHYRNLPYIGILKPEIYGDN